MGELGAVPVIVVVVASALTVWPVPVEALETNVASPAKVAINVSAPAALGTKVHFPVATVAVQLAPVPSFTVTMSVPGIVPLAGGVTVTVKLTVTPCPTTEGLGMFAVIWVVVGITTLSETASEVLPWKFESPL
jgi:hypothetical protein